MKIKVTNNHCKGCVWLKGICPFVECVKNKYWGRGRVGRKKATL
jgi:hypothetical protein